MKQILFIMLIGFAGVAGATEGYVQRADWVDTMLATRAAVQEQGRMMRSELEAVLLAVQRDFPLESDWWMQDLGVRDAEAWFKKGDGVAQVQEAIVGILEKLKDPGALETAYAEQKALYPDNLNATWLSLYQEAAETRRQERLAPLLATHREIIFTKHYSLGGSHYAYTEDLSDSAYPERDKANKDYRMGAALCLLKLQADGTSVVETLLDTETGIIRDPDVSYDGQRVLFSYRKNNHSDDFHLYEMDMQNRAVRQLTYGLGYADYEGCYLPNGDILFNSTRCVQIVDCWWTDVSNLYACDGNGEKIRRVSFDQVHTNYPTVMPDGRVIYTRWEYNDRGQLFPQPLFQMNPDGTGQTEMYGNNAWFPTTLLHSRGIPGTNKILSIASGHHSHQRGKLVVIDPAKGRQEAEGIQLIAPVRETKAARIDAYGQDGAQFQYPYPLDEEHFLVTFSPYGGRGRYQKPYAIYYMDIDGRRELLVHDPEISCNQSVPLAARPLPHARPSQVDYTTGEGTYYIQDIYTGPGLAGVARGSIEKVRVVALDFRVAGVGQNRNRGEAGNALVSTPIAVGNGAWDPKIVLGEAKVHEDGSAMFKVPARTPVYFQAIDKSGYVAQSMRSWSTLQPGEVFSCIGCHEDKNQAPRLSKSTTEALRYGPQELTPFQEVRGGFSFTRYIQPILDKHCVSCHDNRQALTRRIEGKASKAKRNATKKGEVQPFSLLAERHEDERAGRRWSDGYLALSNTQWQQGKKDPVDLVGYPDELVNWITSQSRPDMLPPYHAGSAKSGLITLLQEGHGDTEITTDEIALISCWIDLGVPYCGDYTEEALWTAEEEAHYEVALEKRKAMEALDRESILALISSSD